MRIYTTIGLLVIVMAVLFIPAQIVQAANITVNDPTGAVATNGLCSLSEAILNANVDVDTTGGDCVAGAGPDTIILATNVTLDGATLYTNIEGDTGLPDITSVISIAGGGFTISRTGVIPFRFFNITAAGDLTIDNTTLSDGYALGTAVVCVGICNSNGGNGSGGAIYNQGTLLITNSTLSNNTAQGGAATVTCNAGAVCSANGGDGRGGAIYTNGGTTTVNTSTLSQNDALDSSATCTGGAICFSTTGDGRGGAFFSESSALNINTSTLSDNTSQSFGGGIYNQSTDLLLSGSTLSGNVAASDGGAIYNLPSGTININGSTLNNNAAGGNGGGIYNSGTTSLTNSTISTNIANGAGGGLWNNGTVNINNTTVYNNNSAANSGDALFNSGTATIYSSILATGSGADCANVGTINPPTFSIASDLSCTIPATATIAQLSLGGLANNGGSTLTHKPTITSVVIDQGDCPAGTDQTGAIQPVDTSTAIANAGNGCEIGSVEVQSATVSFQTNITFVSESPGGMLNIPLVLTVTDPIPAGPDIVVTVTYSGGTATAGSDYTGFITLNATFPVGGGLAAGTYIQNVSINIIDDLFTELNETVLMTITNVTNASIGLIPAHTVVIVDNDIPTLTPTPIPTNTPIPPPPPTNTPVPTSTPLPTSTSIPTATLTSTPIPTNTSLPTRTPLPTSTPLPTRTPIPTSTPLPTSTPIPTATVISTATPTDIIDIDVDKDAIDDDEFDITITNNGTGNVGPIFVDETLPTEVVFISVRSSGLSLCQENAGSVVCEINRLPEGDSETIRIRVDPNNLNPDSGTTSVSVGGQLIGQVSEPFIQKVGNPPVAKPGAEVAYTIRVINPTGNAVTNVRVTDEMPEAIEILDASSSSGSVRVSGQSITFTQSRLAAGERVTITINTRIKEEGDFSQIVNEACLSSSGNDGAVCAQMSFLRAITLPDTGEVSPLKRVLPIAAGLLILFISGMAARIGYARR